MSAQWFAFWLNVPTLLCLGTILVYPVCYAAYLSVHRVGLAQLRRGEFPFTGWENYGRVLGDPLFFVAIKNTLSFAIITGPVGFVMSFLFAWLINPLKLKTPLALCFYAPSITGGVRPPNDKW